MLKCDIRKFFASIDHEILHGLLCEHIADADVLWLLKNIVASFHTKHTPGVGLPLGNLTSQLLVNVYMNAFDHMAKRRLHIRYYLRYADDFVIMHEDRTYLVGLLPRLSTFLDERLRLALHPKKVSIATLASGIDFLGWVHFPRHRVLRTSTKRRMLRRVAFQVADESVASYLGLLKHGNAYGLSKIVAASRPLLGK